MGYHSYCQQLYNDANEYNNDDVNDDNDDDDNDDTATS